MSRSAHTTVGDMDHRKFEVVGLLKVNGCCLFTWREPELRGTRAIEIAPDHCTTCIAELRRMGPGWMLIDLRPLAQSMSRPA